MHHSSASKNSCTIKENVIDKKYGYYSVRDKANGANRLRKDMQASKQYTEHCFF